MPQHARFEFHAPTVTGAYKQDVRFTMSHITHRTNNKRHLREYASRRWRFNLMHIPMSEDGTALRRHVASVTRNFVQSLSLAANRAAEPAIQRPVGGFDRREGNPPLSVHLPTLPSARHRYGIIRHARHPSMSDIATTRMHTAGVVGITALPTADWAARLAVCGGQTLIAKDLIPDSLRPAIVAAAAAAC